MSRYEWEAGTLKMPARVFSKFRREFVREYNDIMDSKYRAAYGVWARVKELAKGKRNFPWRDAVETILSRESTKYEGIWLHHFFPTNERKMRAPRRKDFPRASMTVCQVDVGDDVVISFHTSTRCVVWRVPENNHACEIARESAVGRLFFTMLARVKWVRGSGGKIIGNNEYNEGPDENDGGNIVIQRFGPLGKK